MPIGLVVYPELCHGCGNCVCVCPVNAMRSPEIAGGKGLTDEADIIMQVEDGSIKLKHSELCGRCGACARSCPVYAIRLEEMEEAK